MKPILPSLCLRKVFRRDSLLRRAVGAAMVFSFTLNVLANPTGMTVQSGSATARASGSQLAIKTSNLAVLNWQSFNIANGEKTVFNQPSASSLVVNRINDINPSQIFGTLQANGVVVLMNSSGFYFGPNSFVSAAGLVVSTANCVPPQNTGGSWEFNGPPPLASIVNYGSIKVGQNGNVFLIADKVENHGNIEAPGGTIGLAAGQTVTLSERPDGRGMSMDVVLPQGSVDNYGNLIADGGTIALHAKVVNQNGLVQANSVREQNGVIELVASDTLNLGADSRLLAQGDGWAAGSAGGSVTLKSENIFSDAEGSSIVTTGGVNGGNGGNVEVSAPNIQSLNSAMDAHAAAGWLGGEFLLDPATIILGTSGSGIVPANGTVAYNTSGTLTLNVNTAFANKNFSNIKLQATQTITLNANTTWNLSASTGQNTGQLTLQAGTDIIFNSGSKITDANNWSVNLQAGYNFNNNTITYGTGNIYLNGGNNKTLNGSIQLGQGSASLVAGNSIQVGSGYVITTGGGSIYAQALKGNLNTGSDAQGYHFNSNISAHDQAYDLSDGLGGISTAAGGNVTLIAGGNVSSVLPTIDGYYYNGATKTANNGNDYVTAGSGAYGKQAGNVTVVAGGNVTGSYLVANGIGSIFAGVKMDATGNPIKDSAGHYVLGTTGSAGTDSAGRGLALSLIKGGWNVTAAQDIFLQEVRNPNGMFNNVGGSGFNHYFDYAPDAFVNLSAGNQVVLGSDSSTVPRLDSFNNTLEPYIYPSILNVSSGSGGVTLTGDFFISQLILFPSAFGSLTINTSGSFISDLANVQGVPQIFNLIVSDSSRAQYTAAGNFGLDDHAGAPIHDSLTPITLNIGGNMEKVLLAAPEAAQINIGGDMINSRFQGMNLHGSDVTSITVGGDIKNRSAFTSVDLTVLSADPNWHAPDLSQLAYALSSDPTAPTLLNTIYYNSATKVLTYQDIPGKTIQDVLNLLQSLPVQAHDQNGVRLWQDALETIPVQAAKPVQVIDSSVAAALLQTYNEQGGPAPSGTAGYTVGGGGQFNISAHNMDLGTTAGIQSVGVSYYNNQGNYPLAQLFNQGADITVTLSGNLDMLSTSIASLNGGNIALTAGGIINAGSSEFNVSSLFARGIFSTSGGNISVTGGGDINVNGSRIATYDGGDITVKSLLGNINAGTGASTPVTVSGYYVDPITHQVYKTAPQIPFSGILALTFPPRDANYPAPPAKLGNILIEALNGDVTANTSGILQIALNNLNYPDSQLTVLAGYELRDSSGNPVSASDMTGATPVLVSDGRNISAKGSGIIASNAKLEASGNIDGLIFARNNIDLAAQQNINVTALGLGNVNVSSAGGAISGTIIGVGGITASGGSIDASLVSANVTGATSGQSGLGQGTAANATANAASASDASASADKSSTDGNEDDGLKKKKGISLAQKVSRVTVILPAAKKLSEATQTPKI